MGGREKRKEDNYFFFCFFFEKSKHVFFYSSDALAITIGEAIFSLPFLTLFLSLLNILLAPSISLMFQS